MTPGEEEQGQRAAAWLVFLLCLLALTWSQHFPGLGFIPFPEECVTQTRVTEDRGVTEGTEEHLLSFCHMPEACPSLTMALPLGL